MNRTMYSSLSPSPRPLISRHWLALICGWLALTASLTSSAHAQSPDSAKRYLQSRHDRVTQALGRPASAERDRQLSSLLEGLLDYRTLSERSLGAHWADKSAAQRDAFVDLLKQLIERSYRGNLERTEDYRVSYESAEAHGENVVVHTEARSRTNRRAPAVTIDYELRADGDAWRVVDVITDGQSLVQTYRSQFHRIVERDGWDGLMTRMRQRLGD